MDMNQDQEWRPQGSKSKKSVSVHFLVSGLGAICWNTRDERQSLKMLILSVAFAPCILEIFTVDVELQLLWPVLNVCDISVFAAIEIFNISIPSQSNRSRLIPSILLAILRYLAWKYHPVCHTSHSPDCTLHILLLSN